MTDDPQEWHWIDSTVVHAVQKRQIAEHGGASGLRDPHALEAALARPLNKRHYGQPDAADLAAAYAYGIARCHSFTDGNKRTGWIVARLFLKLNGRHLSFGKAEAVTVMNAVAAGVIDEQDLAAWFRERLSGD